MLGGEAENTNVILFGFTKPELKLMIYCTQGKRCLLLRIFRIYHGFEMQNTDYGFVRESMVSVAFQNYNLTQQFLSYIMMRTSYICIMLAD
jgi:hypothetical protein